MGCSFGLLFCLPNCFGAPDRYIITSGYREVVPCESHLEGDRGKVDSYRKLGEELGSRLSQVQRQMLFERFLGNFFSGSTSVLNLNADIAFA